MSGKDKKGEERRRCTNTLIFLLPLMTQNSRGFLEAELLNVS